MESGIKIGQSCVLSVCFINMPHEFRKLNLLNIILKRQKTINSQKTCFEFCHFRTGYLLIKDLLIIKTSSQKHCRPNGNIMYYIGHFQSR